MAVFRGLRVEARALATAEGSATVSAGVVRRTRSACGVEGSGVRWPLAVEVALALRDPLTIVEDRGTNRSNGSDGVRGTR